MTKSYDYSSFREDLVNLYYKTGAEFEDTTFLLTDDQIIKEEFFEDLSNILSSGKSMHFLLNSPKYGQTIAILFQGKYQIYLSSMTWKKS